MPGKILAIDQGTTSSRAIVFDAGLQPLASAQQEFAQIYPQPGWVEHDPEAIWGTVLATCRGALSKAGIGASELAGIGITNQRETTIVWERATGRPIHNAIVWQDRRTADICQALKSAGHELGITALTGLIVDPYFSASKIAWLLDHVPGARRRAERGELAFGTIDTFLLWRLTNGRSHATDATNAARTLLYDIHANTWSEELCRLFRVPRALLPDVKDSAAEFGATAPDLLGAAVPVRGIAGDQQAALVGQACFEPGMVKATYGTGCFAVLNTGLTPVTSHHRLLTTIGYRLAGATTYALEGSIFVAGAAVQWLRDGLQIVASAQETGAMAAAADEVQDVILVPAFVGLGAPHWDADARGAIYGLTRGTGRNELVRAALESVCFQTHDLLAAMRGDWPSMTRTVLRVDGGMVASDWTMQRLADLVDVPIDRPQVLESTAVGAGYLAGLQAGLCPEPKQVSQTWRCEHRFTPAMSSATRNRKLAAWQTGVARTLTRPEG